MKLSSINILILVLFLQMFSNVLYGEVSENGIKKVVDDGVGYKRILEESPIYYKARGDHYRRLGLLGKALNEYEKALMLKVDYADVYYLSACIYKTKALYVQALYDIEEGLKYKDKFSNKSMYYDILFLQIELYLKLQEIGQVKYLLDELILQIKDEIKRERGGAGNIEKYLKYILGKAYFYKGKYLLEEKEDHRINYYDKALVYNYKTDIVQYSKYKLYMSMSDMKRAKLALMEAIRLNPNIILDVRREFGGE